MDAQPPIGPSPAPPPSAPKSPASKAPSSGEPRPLRLCLARFRLTFLGVALALATGLAGCDSSGTEPGGGPGGRDRDIEIRSFEELRQIGQNENFPLDGDYVLAEDIGATDGRGGGKFQSIGRDKAPFTGSFNGAGHSIVGLSLVGESSKPDTLGLFGVIEGARIFNLRLGEVSIEGRPFRPSGFPTGCAQVVGMLAAINRGGRVGSVNVSGEIEQTCGQTGGLLGINDGGEVLGATAEGTMRDVGTGTGGLVGRNGEDGRIDDSESTVDLVDTGQLSGGLVGLNLGTIDESLAAGDVESEERFQGIGGLVGRNAGLITDSEARGTVVSERGAAGGLVWENVAGTIRGSLARGDVLVKRGGGGLVSRNFRGKIVESRATGSVRAEEVDEQIEIGGETREMQTELGGLVGFMSSGEISESKATGDVTAASGDPVAQTGGLVGRISPSSVILESYATGSVGGAAARSAGGLIGRTTGGTVRRSFAAGEVGPAAEAEGGLVGRNGEDSSSSVLTESLFWDTERSGRGRGVGQGRSVEATGLTTGEMQGESARENMQGFGFEDTWQVVDGDYPALRWEDR